MQTDISDGVADLARQGIVDPKRACIVGASYGGYAALAGVTVQQGLYRCAVAVGGVSDLNVMMAWDSKRYGSTSEAMRQERGQMGIKGDSDASLSAVSPRRLAARADAPILLVYGKDDTVVSTDQSRYMAEALRGAGKPVEVLQLPAEDHWLSKAATRTAMLEASVAFVEKYNLRTRRQRRRSRGEQLTLSHAGLAGLLAAWILTGSALAAPPLADYGKLPAVEELKLSPSGEKIAYLAVAGDDRKLMITPLGGGPQLAMKVGAIQLRGVSWLDDGHLLVDTRGAEYQSDKSGVKTTFNATQSTIVDATSGKTTVVFADNSLDLRLDLGL